MEETSKDGVENASAGQKSITLPGPGTKPRPVPRPRNQTKAATIAENGKPGVAHSLPSSKPVLPPKPRRQPPNAPCEKPPSDAANNNEVLLTKKPATSTVKPTLIPEASGGSLKSNGLPTTTTDTISNGPELVDCADSTDQMYEPLRPKTESPSSSSDDGYEDITIPETRKEGPPGYEDITIPETRKETPPPARRAEKRSPPVPRKTSGTSDKPSPPLPRKTSGAVDKPSPPFPRKISGATEKQSPPLPSRKASTKAEKTSPSSHRKLSVSPPTARKLSATRQQEACSVASVTSSGRTLDSNTGVGKSKPLPPKKPLPSLPKGTVLAAKEVISSKPPLPNKPPSPKTEHSQTSVAALAQKLSTIPVFPFRDSDGGKGGSSPRSSPISSPKPSPRGIPSSSLSGKKDSPNVASSPGSSESTRPKLLPKPGTGERSPSQPTPSQSAHCTTGHDIHKQPPARPTPPSAAALSRARSRTIESLEDKESQQTDSTLSGAKGFVRKSSHPERKKKLGSRLKSLRPGSAATSTQSQQSQRRAPPLPPGAVPMLDLKGVSLKVPPVPIGPRPRPSSEYEDGRRSHMKNSVSKSVSVGDLPRVTAEDQSEYSYAYEHTFLGRSPPTGGSLRNPAPRLICESDRPICESDSTYVDPDQSVVSEFMEDIHQKHAPVSYEEADEQTVAGFMDSISKTQTLSGLPAVLSSDESDSESSDDAHEYLVPPVEYNEEDDDDEEDDDASSENSFSSESSDDYCEPPESTSPPEPPAHVDSYDVSEEGIYVEPFHKSTEAVFSSDDDKESVSEEPLYQVYNANTLRRERNLSRRRLNSDVSLNDEASLEELTRGTLRNMRMLWGELPEVMASGILDIIKPEERKRQEAMFEVITSEASYLKSLNILMSHFLNSDELSAGSSLCTLERGQSHVLFSNISSIKAVSESFLQAVRARQKEAVVISSISDIIEDHATKFFEVYVKYCSNQIYQDRALKNLRKNVKFIEAVAKLESNKKAQGLTLQSFLVLPMQRITRLPLLVNAICHRCEPGSDEFHTTDRALAAINKIVNDCNEGARKMERMEEMCLLQTQIEFKTKPLALATSSRYLLRRGDLMFVVEDSRSHLKRGKPKRKPLYMFLFNDILLLTKKKSENRFEALDYATRNMTQVEEPRDPDTVNIEYMFSLVLLENSEGKTKEFLLVGNSETDKTRWMEAFKPPAAEQEGETVYGSWDCPQVNALHNYTAQQPDELSLHEGDVINVLKKLRDGWYHGERLCDGSQGWFPANHTEEIVNEHVRARNLRQRYRLLAASMHLIGGTLRA